MSQEKDSRLKGSVSVSRKVNLGNYSSMDVFAYREFYLDETTQGEAMTKIASEMDNWLAETGLTTNTNFLRVKQAR